MGHSWDAPVCRRTQKLGPIILERRRLHRQLLAVQDLALVLGATAETGEPTTAEPESSLGAAFGSKNMDTNLQLAHLDNEQQLETLVIMRAKIRRSLAHIKRLLQHNMHGQH